ncbi:MAG TPA: SpoIIE family protein phosphatase [Candidatus Kapabacteria bacterium]|nr:SpoIIE family protein phosphatase [Candidatus Kapabacteria bacterium]
MSRISKAISRRLSALTVVQLRFAFTLMAAIGLAAATVVATNTFRHLVTHSDECVWGDDRFMPGAWAVHIVEILPGGRADQAGLKVGDRVLAINGTLVGTGPSAPFRAQELLDKSPVETPIPYVVERDGRVIEATIELTRIVRFYLFAIPALSVLWIVIGLMVVFSRPRGHVQFEFFALAVTSIFALSLMPSTPKPQDPAVMLLWGIAGVAFYIIWFHFFSIFPVDQKIFERQSRRRLIYAPASLLLVLGLLSVVLEMLAVKPPGWLSFVLGYGTFGILMLYFIGGIVLLYRGYRMLSATPERRPITVILIGSILAGAVLVYITVLQTTRAVSTSVLYPQFLIPIVLLLALPVSFGWAIFKHQVMDFRPVVRATLVYGVSMLLLGGLYLSVAYGVGQLFGSLTVKEFQTPVEMLIFVAIALAFEPMKRQMQTTLENRFFPQRRDYSKQLGTYVTEVAETVGTRGVAGLMASTLRSTLELRGCWVLLEDGDGFVQLVARDTEYPAVTLDETDIDTLRSLLRGQHTLIPLETAGDAVGEHLQKYFAYVIGLYAQGRVIGAVLLSRTESGDPLSGSQTPFIVGVTTQGASALEVARLYEGELRRQRYQEELATARRIQESLLPATMPDIPGISISAVSDPAQTVGGDYYEMIQLDEARFLVMIADVSGKGLPASLYMAELHGMVRIASAIHTTPKKILTMLNEHLYRVIERGSFITATLLLFDTERRTVSYARAGHTPIIRRNGKQIDTLVPAGIGLGMNQHSFERFLQEYTVNYEPGETFILYSDGVSEAMNARREEFGEGRLIDVISGAADRGAQEICDGIIQRIVEFRGGAEPNDDVTVVVIRIERDTSVRPSIAAAPERSSVGSSDVSDRYS